MVEHNGHPVRSKDFFGSDLVKGIQQIRGIDIMDHEHIRMGDHDIPWFDLFHSRIFPQDFFRQGKAFPAPFPVIQFLMGFRLEPSCQSPFRIGNQPTVSYDIEKILGNGTYRELLSIGADLVLFQVDSDDVTSLYHILDPITGQQDDAAIKGIPKENPSKAFGDDAPYSIVAEDRSCLLPGRPAAEIAACHQDIPWPYRRPKFRFQQLKSILLHFFDGGNGASLAGDDGIRIDIIAKGPDPSAENFLHNCFSPFINF